MTRPKPGWPAGWPTDRLPHALMLCGPWGIGKATLAFRLARTLLRQTGQLALVGDASATRQVEAGRGLCSRLLDDPADDQNLSDQTARWVATGAHPDLLTIERRFDERKGRALSEITVDDVRRLGSFFSSSPAVSVWRVAIIDAADEMNRQRRQCAAEGSGGAERAAASSFWWRTSRACCRRPSARAAGTCCCGRWMTRAWRCCSPACCPTLRTTTAPGSAPWARAASAGVLQLAKHDGVGADRCTAALLRAAGRRRRRRCRR